MLVPFLALALALSPTPRQQTAPWGHHEWRNGVGALSEYYFLNGTGFPSAYQLANGTHPGSFHHLLSGTTPGSAYFWDNGLAPGTAYFWLNRHEAGSRYYWANGRGCLSEFGWRNGAACSSAEVLVFQMLCIAQAIDVAPCRVVNARLEEWMARASWFSADGPVATIVRMRERID